ncbi:lipid-A-disaccharide synthase N-terminal domain-containing protein [Dyella sp. ASV21]|uniref:lipid-A-disaccharide synthase N-terminal domain-containing protein n=1 Tax=Dyella sp. ASV21 TaxID=2795114 RepID=UPI0018EC0FC7|nr:lipid-A-disaccharide synthase N-terminal domain-containing protein [Dyella sp. ASV21]
MSHFDTGSMWLAAGLVGQVLFGVRFAVQWIHSEIIGKSRFPRVFWQISVAAGVLILAYAIHRRDPVFIAGEALSLMVFARNLQMILRKPHADEPPPPPAAVTQKDGHHS